jgi:MtfA peptidase
LNAIVVLLLFAVALIAWVALAPWRRRRKRAERVAAPFPTAWIDLLTDRWPRYSSLPGSVRAPLHANMLVFIAEKEFVGCRGLQVTEEMRVLVAAQACVLLVRLGIERFDHVRTILLYPDTFLARHEIVDDYGVHTVETRELGGESWPEGKVVLSWRDITDGISADGWRSNVVCHEFAHQLDLGEGVPAGLSEAQAVEWREAMAGAYRRLHAIIERDEASVLPDDAAESPAEFFAFITEMFIEHPQSLRAEGPRVYAVLSEYFGIDPASWSTDAV